MNVRRAVLGFIAPAMLAGIASVAQGIQFPIGYDPQFDGTTVVDLTPACLSLGNGTWPVDPPTCQLDLVAGVDVQDVSGTNGPFPNGTTHWMGAPGFTDYTDIATDVVIDNGALTQFATRPGQILLFAGGVCSGTGTFFLCSAAQLQFEIGGSPNAGFPGKATLTRGTATCNSDRCFEFAAEQEPLVSFYRVPEPGTLGLLLAAFGFGWLTRRRTVSA